MIAVIHVILTRGLFTSGNHLREFAAMIYEYEEPLMQQRRAEGLQRYIADMRDASVYTCRVHPAAQASFLWLTTREFEIVVETFHQGHLMRSVESVVRELRSCLKQANLTAKLSVDLQSPGDAQIYLVGTPKTLGWHILDGLKDNLVSLIVGIVVAIAAKIWLNNYYEEAVAALLALSLFSFWEILAAVMGVFKKSIQWRIHE